MKKSYIIILILIITISLVILFTKLLIIPNLMYNKDLKQDKENKEQNSEELTKVISQYNNPVIPDGFKKVETDNASWNLDEQGNPKGWNDGLVIEDEKGNQFVWVPCTIDGINNTVKYSRYIVNNKDLMPVTDNKLYDNILNQNKACYFVESDQINNEIYKSIEKNQGFYIGRFEAGVNSTTLRTKVTTNQIVVCKKGVAPYNYVPWGKSMNDVNTAFAPSNKNPDNVSTNGAVYLAKSMYSSSSSVTSTLTYGCQWDAMCRYIGDSQRTTPIKDAIELTGSVSTDVSKNIYDLAGNCNEWTMEAYSTTNRVFRGGDYYSASPVSLRLSIYPAGNNGHISFRPTLYIK